MFFATEEVFWPQSGAGRAQGRFSDLLELFRLHGHHHRRGGAGRAADERDRVAGPGHAEDDAGQQPGAATGRLRDHRLGHGHLLRQDRHADAEQDAGGAPLLGRPDAATAARRTGCSPTPRPPWPRDGQPLDWLVLNAAVNSTANLEEKEGKIVTVGNSTEGALLQWLHEAGLDYHKLRGQFPPLYQIHFSSERKRMTTVVRYGDRLVVAGQGAPEWVLEHSTHYQAADGARPRVDAGGAGGGADGAARLGRPGDADAGVRPCRAAAGHPGRRRRPARPPRRPGKRPGLRRLRRHPRSAAGRREGRRRPSAARPASRSR